MQTTAKNTDRAFKIVESSAARETNTLIASRTPHRSLEVIQCLPEETSTLPPIIFVHGANMSAWCWQPFFLSHFADQGYPCFALSLRGHGRSEGISELATSGIQDYVEDLEDLVEYLGQAPILVGHSLGGLICMRYLENKPAAASILLAPLPLGGLLPSLMNLAWLHPLEFMELSFMEWALNSAKDLNAINSLIFKTPADLATLNRYFTELQPESMRALYECLWQGLPTKRNPHGSPLLMISASHDAFFSPRQIKLTADAFKADHHNIEDTGHNLMLEGTWQDCADYMIDWIPC